MQKGSRPLPDALQVSEQYCLPYTQMKGLDEIAALNLRYLFSPCGPVAES